MSFRAMANGLLVISLLTGVIGIARCQANSPTTIVGCLSEKSGKLILDGEDAEYLLVGDTAGLKAHVGDQLSVSGDAANGDNEYQNALAVTSFRTIVRRDPAGVKPQLGDPRGWLTFSDKRLGVVVRIPKAFPTAPDSGDHNFVDRTGIVKSSAWSVPTEVYPHSNFNEATFEIDVDPAIRSEGTCRQFGRTAPGYTFLKTLNGLRYSQTQLVGVGLGAAEISYYFHTFQNGLCYEVTFTFLQSDGTGLEASYCAMQWLITGNGERLAEFILSRVSFVAPESRNVARGTSARQPLVTSLYQSISEDASYGVFPSSAYISWSTQGADYVQLKYPCVKGLSVGEMKCGVSPDRNYPAKGSENVAIANLSSRSVQLALTVEPFSDGVGNPTGSKTFKVEIPPTPHP